MGGINVMSLLNGALVAVAAYGQLEATAASVATAEHGAVTDVELSVPIEVSYKMNGTTVHAEVTKVTVRRV